VLVAALAVGAGCGDGGQDQGGPAAKVTASDCARVSAGERPDLVFTRDPGLEMDVYAMSLDDRRLTRLTRELGPDSSPTISPDGCSVAFVASLDAGFYAVGVDGKNRRVLVRDLDNVNSAEWSPDGAKIAVALPTSRNSIRTVDAAGGQLAPVPIGTEEFFATSATWSPDGSQIAFAGAPVSEVEGRVYSDIYVVGADGGEPQRITTTEVVIEQELEWSPDGRWIAYTDTNVRPPGVVGGRPYGERGVFVIASDGSERRRLTREDDRSPTWSPDGQIAFARREGDARSDGGTVSSSSIRSISVDGTNERVILPAGEHALYYLSWSRAGSNAARP
jgi:Tol biopolymer transport system component